MRRPALLPLSRSPIFLLSLFLILALAACGQQTADRGPWTATPTVDHGPWTATSTVYRPPSTVYPPPFTLTPTPEPITLAKTFGLTGDALKAFRGAERAITRAENGDYLVTAKVRNPETGELEEIQLTLDPASFDIHPEITNPLGLDTLQAKDADGNPVTLLWLPETHEFRLAYDLQPLYDGVNTSNPALNPEVYAQLPVFTIDDIQSGFAVRNLLLTFSQQMAEGKTIDQILQTDPKALGEDYLKYGGASLLFNYFENNPQDPNDDLKIAFLKGLGNETAGVYSRLKLRYLPYFGIVDLNGQKLLMSFTAFFDPLELVEATHPELPAKDLKNWKFISQVLVDVMTDQPYAVEDLSSMQAFFKKFFQRDNPIFPYLAIYATAPYLDPNDPNTVVFNPELVEVPDPKNPNKTIQVPKGQLSSVDPLQSLLAQLLQIKGNDVTCLSFCVQLE